MTREITIDDLKRYRALVETGSVLDKNTVLNIISHAGKAGETIQRKQNAIETLDRIITQQCQAALDATGLHHLIDEDGDGDWSAVWEGLQELGESKRKAEQNLGAALDANKRWAHRSSREHSELFKANNAIHRVRELRRTWCDASYDPMNTGLNIAGVVNAIDRALAGVPND
ncbi:hypothetical protein [Glutamicibacter nicotianae]|uniref:Uncharacterized protein n=1 Tax=Glutamicibacter nicotianae TaxID=37929 RepID=A0ABQ0RLN3_GLUNI|nr:hypothetical protein [Glutamicibacter nicotianae]GEC12713.1 hypothetical protein ANI01nite_19160 [Glutamicibacter nicotianae]